MMPFLWFETSKIYINYLLLPPTRCQLNFSWSEIWNMVNYGSVIYKLQLHAVCSILNKVLTQILLQYLSTCLFTSACFLKNNLNLIICIFEYLPGSNPVHSIKVYWSKNVFVCVCVCTCMCVSFHACGYVCIHTRGKHFHAWWAYHNQAGKSSRAITEGGLETHHA